MAALCRMGHIADKSILGKIRSFYREAEIHTDKMNYGCNKYNT